MRGRAILRLKKEYLARWQLYAFLILPLAYIIVFAYVPMIGAQIAFRNYDFTKGIWGSDWVGLKNIQRFFKYYNSGQIILNTLTLSLYGLIAGFPLPILLALILNALPLLKYKKLVQTVSYMPHFISVVVMVGMVMQLFNPLSGAVGNLFFYMTGRRMPDIFARAAAFPDIYVWSGIWQGLGWGSIIYIAALSNADPELHEAAEIDGASRFKRVIHIDLPVILPTATIMLILNAGGIMSVGFEKVLLLQNELNKTTSEVISTYVYKVGLGTSNNFSYGTAIGLFNSIINFTLLVLVNGITRKLSSTSLW